MLTITETPLLNQGLFTHPNVPGTFAKYQVKIGDNLYMDAIWSGDGSLPKPGDLVLTKLINLGSNAGRVLGYFIEETKTCAWLGICVRMVDGQTVYIFGAELQPATKPTVDERNTPKP